MRSRKKSPIIGLALVAAAGIGGSALAANVTTATTNAGQGTSVTDGYNVTNVHFLSSVSTANNSTANITTVRFNIYLGTTTATAVNANHTVLARINTGNWANCTVNGSYPAVTCTVTAVAASSVSQVEIVAYKSS